MPGRFELKPTLAKIWQAPDNFRIMDPLPPLHRRGIIIGALMVAPVEPEPIQDEQPQEQAAAPSQPQTQQPTGIEQQWRSYRVEPGKTLAQLFRDHNLPPTDVYAMAKVEGAGKPLSNLQNGQMVQVRQNASGGGDRVND
ncbi:hypothetical protein L1887_42882 [Cichorium endivia]|nr:hypothetical protein L1887_42882 [Cichorium endivia]